MEPETENVSFIKDAEVFLSNVSDRYALSDNIVRFNKNTFIESLIFPDRELERLFLEASKEGKESVLLEKKALVQQRIKDLCPIAPLYYRLICKLSG